MRNTLYDGYEGIRLPREIQLKRIQKVIREELTPLQREVLMAYYFQERTVADIARERGVNKTTVWRTLRRAERNLRKYLKY